MTDQDRRYIDELVGAYGIECATHAENMSPPVLAARGALMVGIEGVMERHDAEITELREKLKKALGNMTTPTERRRAADRIMTLERELETCKRRLEAAQARAAVPVEPAPEPAVVPLPVARPAPPCHACVNDKHAECGGPESGCGCAAMNHYASTPLATVT